MWFPKIPIFEDIHPVFHRQVVIGNKVRSDEL